MKKIVITGVMLAIFSNISYAAVSVPDVVLAITAGNNELIEQYLNEGGNPNATAMQGQSLIFSAVASMNTGAMDKLIAAGANVNDGGTIMGKRNMSPLYLAVSTRNIQAAKMLLDAGADINDRFYGIPLTQAASFDADMRRLVNEAAHKRVSKTSLSGLSGMKTILSTLTLEDIDKAKLEADKGKRLSYDLNEKGLSFKDALKYGIKSSVRLLLYTPYSLYRHGEYEEKQNYIPFDEETRQSIIADKNKVYVVPYYLNVPGMPGTLIKHLVIKKNGVVYQPEPLTNSYMQSLGNTFAYGFSIDLFDGQPMEIVAIDAQNDKQLIMPIDKHFYDKRGWY